MIDLSYGTRTFAQRQINVAAEPVAMVYAQALIDAAKGAGKLEPTLAELDSFVYDVLDTQPKLATVLASAQITPEEKNELLEKGLGKQASRLLINFLKVVSGHGRLDIIRAIRDAAETLHDRLIGRTRVQFASAIPLDDAAKERLTNAVQQWFGGQPVVETHVWPELVGGIMMRVGDTVYDGSISTSLERLRQEMIDRSVYEIQSGRDRFSTSEGN